MSTRRVEVLTGGKRIAVDLDSERGVRLSGSGVYADITRVDASTYSLVIQGKSHTIRVRNADNAYIMSSAGREARTEVESERSRLLKRAGVSAALAEHGTTIFAPMPALVVRLEVEIGQTVVAGQGLVVLEAMKMENEIRAPRAGKVKSISATPGKPVEIGETLVILE
jgi:biotin carboxyl carrier protein